MNDKRGWEKSPVSMKCRTKAVDLRLTLYGFYNSQWIKTTFFQVTLLLNRSILIYPRSHSNLPPNYFWLFPSWKCKASCIQKNRIRLQLIANHPVFQFETEFFPRPLFVFSDCLMFCIKKFSNRFCSRNSGFRNAIALHFIKKAGTPRPFN